MTRTRWLLGTIVGLFLVLALGYSVVIPPFEATDEVSHFEYAQFLKAHGRLPRQSHDRSQLENVVAHNPPLYYIVVALITTPVDASDLARIAPLNPDFVWGDLNAGGPFVHLHDPAAEQFPWRGALLALHLARLVSAAAGVGSVIGAYLIGRRLLRSEAGGLAVAALLAFLPSFLFTSATVHNDALVTMFGILALARLLALAEEDGRWQQWGIAGALIAGAALSKVVGFLLLPLVGLVALFVWRRRGLRPALGGAALAGGTALALTAPWLAWNLGNYGEPFGYLLFSTNPLFPIRDEPLPLPRIIDDMGPRSLLFLTSLLAFGYMDRFGPPWLYDLGRLAVLLAIGGLLLRLARWPEGSARALARPAVIVGSAALALFLLALGRYIQTFLSGGHGRYLFPVAPVILAGLVAGWSALLPQRARSLALAAVASGVALLALATPFFVIAPGYALAGEVSAEAAAALPQEPIARFGDAIELVAAAVAPATARPGEPVTVALTWRAAAPVGRSYHAFVQLVGPAGGAGGVNAAPGGGLAATVRWRPGVVIADRLAVPVAADAPPGLYEVWTGFFHPSSGERLPVTAGGDRGGATVVGRVKVPPPASDPLPVPLGVVYGNEILLEGRGELPERLLGSELAVSLAWRALARPTADYSLSLQLAGPTGLVAQVDGPLGGALPTSAWEREERIVTRSTLPLPAALPAGTYTLHAIVYRLADGSRLRAGASDDAPRIADVTVGRP
ncbi:MAG: glycosyltransferase family 39 protein [Chloroflexota bacterium]|nr:glycosyltransferase family 39 protein [Dehalococcoidia bacterium]MDW8252672.1 glycosyltransferase family 39 protein [Chloroflexota bacterium]